MPGHSACPATRTSRLEKDTRLELERCLLLRLAVPDLSRGRLSEAEQEAARELGSEQEAARELGSS